MSVPYEHAQTADESDSVTSGNESSRVADSDDPALYRVTLALCGPCLTGAGGECHTPGCSLWMNRAPDLPIRMDADGKPVKVHADAWGGEPVDIDGDIEPDDILKAISGACDNGLPFDLDGRRVDLESFLFGRGKIVVVDPDDEVAARFSIRVEVDTPRAGGDR